MVNIALQLPNITIHTAVKCHLIYHVPLWFACLTKLSTCFECSCVRHPLLANCFPPHCSDYPFLKSAPPAVSFSSRWCLCCLEGFALSCWCSVNQPLRALSILHLYTCVGSKLQYFCDLTISLGMVLDYTRFRFLFIEIVWWFAWEWKVLFRNSLFNNSASVVYGEPQS